MTLISLALKSIEQHDIWQATNPTILKHSASLATDKIMWYTAKTQPKSQPKWHHYKPKWHHYTNKFKFKWHRKNQQTKNYVFFNVDFKISSSLLDHYFFLYVPCCLTKRLLPLDDCFVFFSVFEPECFWGSCLLFN